MVTATGVMVGDVDGDGAVRTDLSSLREREI